VECHKRPSQCLRLECTRLTLQEHHRVLLVAGMRPSLKLVVGVSRVRGTRHQESELGLIRVGGHSAESCKPFGEGGEFDIVVDVACRWFKRSNLSLLRPIARVLPSLPTHSPPTLLRQGHSDETFNPNSRVAVPTPPNLQKVRTIVIVRSMPLGLFDVVVPTPGFFRLEKRLTRRMTSPNRFIMSIERGRNSVRPSIPSLE
jgi:hypothetical protein